MISGWSSEGSSACTATMYAPRSHRAVPPPHTKPVTSVSSNVLGIPNVPSIPNRLSASPCVMTTRRMRTMRSWARPRAHASARRPGSAPPTAPPPPPASSIAPRRLILPQAVDNHRAVVAGARDSHRGAAVSRPAKHRIQHRIHDHHITSNVSHEDAADGSVRITR